MWEHLQGYSIVLGSQSPRRVELLRGLDLPFTQRAMPDIDESYPDSLALEEVALYIAQRKAEAYREQMERDTLLITADTVVIVAGKLLGKPSSPEEARQMLRLLAGTSHVVVTGVCLKSHEKQTSFSARTQVHFAPLSDAEIDYYVAHYNPMDKAGAYGIQEWIGYRAIKGIEGSFYNVMGLPVHQLAEHLLRF